MLQDKCDKGHPRSWRCFQKQPSTCDKCEKATREAQKRLEKQIRLQEKRDKEEQQHLERLAKLDAELEARQQNAMDARMAEERAQVIKQKEKDLAAASSMPIQLPISTTRNNHIIADLTKTDQGTESPRAPEPERQTPQLDIPKERTMELTDNSEAGDDWLHQKRVENAQNDTIDEIMGLVGLENVKSGILRIKGKIDTAKRQQADLRKERFNMAFLGNPGTGSSLSHKDVTFANSISGKTTVARLYAKALTSLKALAGDAFIETTGSRIAHGGVAEAKKHIEALHNAGGGVLFLDEAYQLTQKQNSGGTQVLDFLLAEMENNIGKMVFIFAGYSKEMESFFEHNPGLPSRIPYRITFDDYQDAELLWFLHQLIQKRWNGRMTMEDGPSGLYMRIAARRVGRGRGRPGFGNARALEIAFSKIAERQADRLKRERRRGSLPDDFVLSKEDLIGPEPSITAILRSKTWQNIQKLTGLKAVKESLEVMAYRIVLNYKRELEEKEPIEVSLNRVFLGNPGTGKTSVGKQYGKMLVELGLLSNGEGISLLKLLLWAQLTHISGDEKSF